MWHDWPKYPSYPEFGPVSGLSVGVAVKIIYLVRSGMDTVRNIEQSSTDRRDRPAAEVKITSASCKDVTPYVEEFKPSDE